jgi:hypothetical protein
MLRVAKLKTMGDNVRLAGTGDWCADAQVRLDDAPTRRSNAVLVMEHVLTLDRDVRDATGTTAPLRRGDTREAAPLRVLLRALVALRSRDHQPQERRTMTRRPRYTCSFCGTTQEDTRRMTARPPPHAALICATCLQPLHRAPRGGRAGGHTRCRAHGASRRPWPLVALAPRRSLEAPPTVHVPRRTSTVRQAGDARLGRRVASSPCPDPRLPPPQSLPHVTSARFTASR